jgi:chemotaxis signal transduction protein
MVGIGNFITGFIAFLSWRAAHKAAASSETNAAMITAVKHSTDGLLADKIKAARDVAWDASKKAEQDAQAGREAYVVQVAEKRATAAAVVANAAIAHPIPVSIVADTPVPVVQTPAAENPL